MFFSIHPIIDNRQSEITPYFLQRVSDTLTRKQIESVGGTEREYPAIARGNAMQKPSNKTSRPKGAHHEHVIVLNDSMI
jgi:hypothetical protein